METVQGEFDAEKFVDELLGEGAKIPCDESYDSFNFQETVPAYYDESKFKRGQKFFYHHIFALFFSKLLGLLSVLAVPSISSILIHTKMSSSTMTAYRRYLATLFHMCIWYKSDFTPGSRLWQSITAVRNMHNSASKRACAGNLHRINQKDMALTQFGFMGYAVARREKVGLHNVRNEDWEAFIHVWRVVGYVMGIEDRFNICRESVEDTTAICTVLIERIFKPRVSRAIEEKDEEFMSMSSYLIEGMWAMNPTLYTKTLLAKLYLIVQTPYVSNNNNNAADDKYESIIQILQLNKVQKFWLNVGTYVMWHLQYNFWRLYHNYVKIISLWLMRVFPFLAYYKYGYAKAHVTVLPDDNKRA